MTRTFENEPWRALPPEAADAIEPALPDVTREILAAIAGEVPEYQRPLEGSFGRGVRIGVDEALRQFVALVRDPDAGREAGREVYVGLGRGELHQGRTLDSLLAAYRIGARVAWRRIAAAGRAGGLGPDVLSTLAEAVFAYIDELSADSVEGYAQAQAEQEGERGRRRRALAQLLLRDPPAEPADVRAAAERAGWTLPRRAAALACAEEDLERVEARLPAGALTAAVGGLGCAIVPDPDGPGRRAELEAAAGGAGAALGPAGELAELPGSWSLARACQGTLAAGSLAASGPLARAEDHLPELLLAASPEIAARFAARRLGPLEALTPRARERMRETALAYVQQAGNAVRMARAMHVHPQTARYRTARLRELLGDELNDPDARLELELALRAPS
ncbi:MAG: PucR family transcriptional regulator [Solirubrobacterales bacterium]